VSNYTITFIWDGADANKAVLDAASYADQHGLWVGNKAKVPAVNEPVAVLSDTGEVTDYINVYRTNTSFLSITYA
jgi:hypothetical protein